MLTQVMLLKFYRQSKGKNGGKYYVCLGLNEDGNLAHLGLGIREEGLKKLCLWNSVKILCIRLRCLDLIL